MASPAIVTGNVQDLTGTNQQYAEIVFELVNLDGNLPVVIGTTIVAPIRVVVQCNSSGAFSTNIWGNDNISPAGTYYAVSFAGSIAGYWQITGSSANLNTQAQIIVVPVVPSPTGDDTYLRLDGGNNPTGDIVPANNETQNLGSINGQWNATLHDLYVGNVVTSALIPTDTTGQQLGNTSNVWDAYLGNVVSTRTNSVRIATSFPGADIGAQVNAAVADLPTSSGYPIGTVFIPSGSYTLSTQIAFNSPFVNLMGAGSGSVFITSASGFNAAMIQIGTNVLLPYVGGRITGLRLLGNSNTSNCGIRIGGTTGMVIDDVNVTGCYGAGIWLDNSITNPTGGWTERVYIGQVMVEWCGYGLRATLNSQSIEYLRVMGLHVGSAGPVVSIEGSGTAHNSEYHVMVNTNADVETVFFQALSGASVLGCTFFLQGEDNSGSLLGFQTDSSSGVGISGTAFVSMAGNFDEINPSSSGISLEMHYLTLGTDGASQVVTTPGTIQAGRLTVASASAPTITSSSGWGTGASVAFNSLVPATDNAFTLKIVAGTSPSANPTVTVTYSSGFPYTTVSTANSGPTVVGCANSATAVIVTYYGTPVASTTYYISVLSMGTV